MHRPPAAAERCFRAAVPAAAAAAAAAGPAAAAATAAAATAAAAAMEEDGVADLSTAPPLPDGPSGGPPIKRGYGGPPRRGYRGGGPRGEGGPPRVSVFDSLRRRIVTLGDDVCLIPTQILNLSQSIAEAVLRAREEAAAAAATAAATAATTQQQDAAADADAAATGDGAAADTDAQPVDIDSVDTPQPAEGDDKEENAIINKNKQLPVNLEKALIDIIVSCAAKLPVKTGLSRGFRA